MFNAAGVRPGAVVSSDRCTGVTQAVALFVGVATAIAALITAVANLRTSRRAVVAVQEVHTMVNQQRTDAQLYQAVLVAALTRAGVAVPVDQSLGAPPPAPRPAA